MSSLAKGGEVGMRGFCSKIFFGGVFFEKKSWQSTLTLIHLKKN